MLRLVLAAAVAAGCYAPTASPGVPCGPGGECPAGQECRGAVCFPVGAPHDAFESPVDEAVVDAMFDAAPDGPGYVAWGTPVVLTSLESAASGESDPSVTTNKLTVVFAADVPTNDGQIYIATRTALTDSFTITELTAVNSVGFNEQSPEISGDGTTLFFSSNRTGVYEFYSSTFTTSWSVPALRTDLSTTGDDEDLAISPDGLTAVAVLDASTNLFRIHTRSSTANAFGSGTTHAELSVLADIAGPTVTNGGEIIYFHAGATRQLYRATKKGNGSYTNPAPVSELNMAGVRCAAPFVLQSDDYMIFERASDLYETTR